LPCVVRTMPPALMFTSMLFFLLGPYSLSLALLSSTKLQGARCTVVKQHLLPVKMGLGRVAKLLISWVRRLSGPSDLACMRRRLFRAIRRFEPRERRLCTTSSNRVFALQGVYLQSGLFEQVRCILMSFGGRDSLFVSGASDLIKVPCKAVNRPSELYWSFIAHLRVSSWRAHRFARIRVPETLRGAFCREFVFLERVSCDRPSPHQICKSCPC